MNSWSDHDERNVLIPLPYDILIYSLTYWTFPISVLGQISEWNKLKQNSKFNKFMQIRNSLKFIKVTEIHSNLLSFETFTQIQPKYKTINQNLYSSKGYSVLISSTPIHLMHPMTNGVAACCLPWIPWRFGGWLIPKGHLSFPGHGKFFGIVDKLWHRAQ